MKDKQISKIKTCVQDLVYEKIQLKKAYNYYHCVRDAEQFRHIEDNYGIGTPTSIGFTPLIKKHIDVLVGEYLELDPELNVTCKDDKTISNIMRDKKLKIDTEVYQFLEKQLYNIVFNIFFKGQENAIDPYIERQMRELIKDLDNSFVSDYEIAAQNILTWLRQSRDIDLKNKMRELFTDLLITGICYYRTKTIGDTVRLEILNPLDTFVERNRYHFYLNKSSRCVIRRWLTKDQILVEFGDELTKEQKAKLDDEVFKGERNMNTVYVRTPAGMDGLAPTREVPSPGILGGLEVTPVFPWNTTGMYNYMNLPVIAVYETEWLEFNKDKMERGEGVQIGEDIFITREDSENIVRSQSNPKECTLSINGMFFLDKNGSPFSIVLNTSDLQDWIWSCLNSVNCWNT